MYEGTGYSFKRLSEGIIALSVADEWKQAKREWDLDRVIMADSDADEWERTCVCGYHPITELCELCNRLNGNTVIVGNVCVKRFLGLPVAKIFDALRRVLADIHSALNPEAIAYALKKDWIDPADHEWYLNTWRMRSMGDGAWRERARINTVVLAGVKGRRVPTSAERLAARVAESMREVGVCSGTALTPEAFDMVRRSGWLTGWEEEFYSDTRRKSSDLLSERQRQCRVRINRKVVDLWRAQQAT